MAIFKRLSALFTYHSPVKPAKTIERDVKPIKVDERNTKTTIRSDHRAFASSRIINKRDYSNDDGVKNRDDRIDTPHAKLSSSTKRRGKHSKINHTGAVGSKQSESFISAENDRGTMTLGDKCSMSPTTKVQGYLSGNLGSAKKKRKRSSDVKANTGSAKKVKFSATVEDAQDEEYEGDTLVDVAGSVNREDAGEEVDNQQRVETGWDEGEPTLLDSDETDTKYDTPGFASSARDNKLEWGEYSSATRDREQTLSAIQEEEQDELDFLDEIRPGESAAKPMKLSPRLEGLPPHLVSYPSIPGNPDLRTLKSPTSPATPSLFLSSETLRNHGWPDDCVLMMQKLHQRGREPILPGHWAMDFPYLPDALFAEIPGGEAEDEESDDEESETGQEEEGDDKTYAPPTPASIPQEEEYYEPAFINALAYGRSKHDFHATRALSHLFQLPSRARDRVRTRLAPELLIERGIQDYITWAYADAGLAAPPTIAEGRFLAHRRSRKSDANRSDNASPTAERISMPPLLVTHSAPRTLDSRSLERNVLTRLINLRQDWFNYFAHLSTGIQISKSTFALTSRSPSFSSSSSTPTDQEEQVKERDLPTVFAIVISHTNVAVVAYTGGDKLRQIGHFDLGAQGFDVWNGLAIAIVAVNARNVANAIWETWIWENEEELETDREYQQWKVGDVRDEVVQDPDL